VADLGIAVERQRLPAVLGHFKSDGGADNTGADDDCVGLLAHGLFLTSDLVLLFSHA